MALRVEQVAAHDARSYALACVGQSVDCIERSQRSSEQGEALPKLHRLLAEQHTSSNLAGEQCPRFPDPTAIRPEEGATCNSATNSSPGFQQAAKSKTTWPGCEQEAVPKIRKQRAGADAAKPEPADRRGPRRCLSLPPGPHLPLRQHTAVSKLGHAPSAGPISSTTADIQHQQIAGSFHSPGQQPRRAEEGQ